MHRYVKFHGFHELTGAPFLGVHAPFSFAPSTFSGMDTDSIPMNLSIPYADDYFRRELENWNDTHPLAYALRKMIRKANIDPNVNKVICFGLGDPCRAPGENNPKYHAVWRHIVAWIIAEELAKKNNMFIELISQEPGYSHVAQQFLPRAGFIIHIDGITAVPMVDRKTVVFAPCAKFPIKEVIADVAKPAAMFWPTIKSREITEFEMNALPLRKLKHTGGIKVVSDHPCPDTPRTRAMIDEYQEFLFPKTDLMGEMTLYVFDRDLAEEPTGPRVVDPEISSTQQDTGPKFLTELSIQAIDDDAPCGLSHEQPSPAA
ncbi:hypothetical protein F4780DRAFT_78672 [Xylariomycetidae sp. FL0641]|nr:hypothetical protein F4780DRAFT_78672 [Xylariomycetidae sp. FL0641]